MQNLRPVEILECSLRDGSYAIDFNFTAEDTALLVRKLTEIGFNLIEIGHGVGLGAAQAGKGIMPDDDIALMKAARENSDAKIGMFYIPRISSKEQLEAVADAGLDFVRVGENVTEAENIFDHLGHAKKLGLTVGMNFMKSYAVSAKDFGLLARRAVDAGADIIYLVDSVGGMVPREVEEYFSEIRKHSDCDLGFHGHDNLKMSVANTMKAYECGARFLDATVMGFGRGAGNAPTEALACLLEEAGVSTGIDITSLLRFIDTYICPLVKNFNPYSTQETAMGFGKFHSSYMPKILEASRKYNAEANELIIRMGRHDPIRIDDQMLEEVARELENTINSEKSDLLVSYTDLKVLPDSLVLNDDAVGELIKGISVTCAKRRRALPVIEIVLLESEKSNFVLTEHVWDSERIVMGRITVGSIDSFKEIADILADSSFKFIIDPQKSGINTQELGELIAMIGSDRIFALDLEGIKKKFLHHWVASIVNNSNAKTMLMYGDDEGLKSHLLQYTLIDQLFVVDPDATEEERTVAIRNIDDWVLLNIKVDMVYNAIHVTDAVKDKLLKFLKPNGKILSPYENVFENHENVFLNIDAAYEGVREYLESPDYYINKSGEI